MEYYILCGGEYPIWATPRQLVKINEEPIVERTIRLLRWHGINDIHITANGDHFDYLNEKYGVGIWKWNKGENNYLAPDPKTYWVDAFPRTYRETCYIFGDVVFSPEAIKTIVETQTDSIEFFGSKEGSFDNCYIKKCGEPFAFKVVDYEKFYDDIDRTKRYQDEGLFWRRPVAWELWQVIKKTPLNIIDWENFTAINDYTCDVDREKDVAKIQKIMKKHKGE